MSIGLKRVGFRRGRLVVEMDATASQQESGQRMLREIEYTIRYDDKFQYAVLNPPVGEWDGEERKCDVGENCCTVNATWVGFVLSSWDDSYGREIESCLWVIAFLTDSGQVICEDCASCVEDETLFEVYGGWIYLGEQ